MAEEKLPVMSPRGPVAVPTSEQRLPRTHRLIKTLPRWVAVLLFLSVVRFWTLGGVTQPVQNKDDSQAVFNAKGPLVGRKAEELFLTVPNEASAIVASRQYASKPHRAGTEGDFVTAKAFLALLQQELGILPPTKDPIFPAGFDASRNATLSIPHLNAPQAWIDIYYPVINTPLDRSLEVIGEDGKSVWQANLEEVADAEDPYAEKYAEAVPAFHGLSVSGQAQGKLVYANYGRQEDYAALVAKGVDLNGTIVIARYGGIFRGLKVQGAQELGAAGVLIYSDPRDDGTVTPANGYATYPHGPARNPTAVQRGSVTFISNYAGDPTTPGYPAYENSTRVKGGNFPSIPSLPISWATAEALLKEVDGNEREVRLVNNGDTKITPIWNVMGAIPGHIRDEVVVVGNHRDAWVLGATDPSSGTVSVHEVIRGFGTLLRQGWKPLRTILFASWDAEEYGLIGSTEWGEDFPEFIGKHVIAYLNLDSSTSGSRLGASASPSLSHLYRDVAEGIAHPTQEDRSLWDARSDQGTLFGIGNSSEIDAEVLAMYEAEMQGADSIGVNPLGSGSDYTVFLQHIGIACTNGGFSSTLHDPVYHYHSVFDSEHWQEQYGDPGFRRHVAVAKHLGSLALRLSGSIILPLNTTHYALQLETYLNNIEAIALSSSFSPDFAPLRDSIHSLQAASLKLDIEKWEAERNLKRILKKWKRRHSIFAGFRRKLGKLVSKLRKIIRMNTSGSDPVVSRSDVAARSTMGHQQCKERTAEEHQMARAFAIYADVDGDDLTTRGHQILPGKLTKAAERVQAVNQKLVAFERGFISEEGISKDRAWYKHLGVAPGKWLGYGATPLPAVEEALTIEKNATLAEHEAFRLKVLLNKLERKLLA